MPIALELATTRPAALGLVLAATVASLTASLGAVAPGFSFAFPLGMLAWLRSSSQDPMVAARLASLPLLPIGVSEDMWVGMAAGGTSACLFNRDRGVQSGTATEEPEKVVICLIFGRYKAYDSQTFERVDITALTIGIYKR